MENHIFVDNENSLLVIHHDKDGGNYHVTDHDNDDYNTPNDNRVYVTGFLTPSFTNEQTKKTSQLGQKTERDKLAAF